MPDRRLIARALVAAALLAGCSALAGCSPIAAAAGAGVTSTSMSSVRADMQARAAEARKPGPDGKPADPVTVKAYDDALACLDKMEEHMRKQQAARLAARAINTGLSFAGPAGALAAPATDLMTSMPMDQVSC
jgi:hypothetical protein